MYLKQAANLLPDIPRWVETRSMLLNGRGEFLYAGHPPASDFVVRSINNWLISVVGHPTAKVLSDAIAKSRSEVEVLAVPENAEHVADILKSWQRSIAILHQLERPAPFQNRSDALVRFVDRNELDFVERDSPDLAEELFDALEFTDVAAVIVEDRPVSFCYAGGETETLWDISIDTLPACRRRGYAEQGVSFLIEQMMLRGKQPVWGAEESNVASLNLARKLGFRPVDRVMLFRQS
jgi:GNAT superfamily N-acetyltransferase